MTVRNFIISLLIISTTVIGGTCLFGFCASADSGDIADFSLEKDIPITDIVIKEDGKLNGQTLTPKFANVDFPDNFDLASNQKKVIVAERKIKPKQKKVIASKKTHDNDMQNISVEMNSVLADIRKQEQEMRTLLSELKSMKDKQENANNQQITKNSVPTDIKTGSKQQHAENIEIKTKDKENNKIETAKVENKQANNFVDKRDDTEHKIIAKQIEKENEVKSKKKKFTPMLVENVKQKKDNSYTSAFKDYSMDNSGRDRDDDYNIKSGGFEKAFSALRPEKVKKQNNLLAEKRKKADSIEDISKESVKKFHNAYVNIDDVKKDFYKTYMTENKYLKHFEAEDDDQKNKQDKKGYDILQLKIEFQENSAALSAVDVNILRYFVYIAQNDPTKGVQISISQENMKDINKKKLTARRLAIVSAIFKEEGLSDSQIIPVLTDRDTESFTFSIISVDKMENFSKSEGKDMFGDNIGSSQTFRTMRW